MNKYIKENDKLVQLIACTQKSYFSGLPAQCSHHYIRRSDYLWRWDLLNIIPLTLSEHIKVHEGKIPEKSLLKSEQKELDYGRNLSLKKYLFDNCITFDEFCKQVNTYLKKALNLLEHNPNMSLYKCIEELNIDK